MSEPAELSHGVLLRVAEFLRKLPADQLAELAAGTARLVVLPKGGQPARPATKPLPVTADQVRIELATIADPGAGRRFLADLKLTVPQLVTLGRELGVGMPGKPRKDDALDRIVQATIGRRRDFEALSRPDHRVAG